jgi:hypothetical protein
MNWLLRVASACRTGNLGDWLWFLTWAVASSCWCATTAWQIGATFDEPLYIARGLEGWRAGSHAGLMRLGTMPLPIDLETLPLHLWERWRGTPFDAQQDLERLLPWARLVTLVFWWLLLFYARLAGRLLAGPWAGRLAVALIACEPNFLAHASLATTDLALTACVLALAYHFRIGRDAGWFLRRGLPGFWFGAAVLAKASGLVYGPLCLVVIEVERLSRSGAFKGPAVGPRARIRQISEALRPLRRDLAWIVGGGIVLVFVYCGCDWRTQPSFVAWADSLPYGLVRSVMQWLANHLRIFSNAGEGLVRQIKHNFHGHGTYLLGRSDQRAIWYYFPLVLTIKLGLALLVAPVLVGLIRLRALCNWAFLAAVVLVVCSLRFQVQIGLRLVLPLVAFAAVGVAAALASAWQESSSGWKRRLLTGGMAAGLVWMVLASAVCWPNGLCYTNELWGSRQSAYQRVSDGNFDWGQGLPELARWINRQGLDGLDVWYFGTDPRCKRSPFRLLQFETLGLNRPEQIAAAVRGKHLAVSTTILHGCPIENRQCQAAIAFLRTCRPVSRTTTFLIYDFTMANFSTASAVK